MREIKFRAWDKQNQRMIYFDYRDKDDYFIDLDTNDRAPVVAITEEGTFERYIRKSYLLGAELIQYTGLVDKNGREIYEGDILKGVAKNLVVVEFLNGSFGFIDKRKISFFGEAEEEYWSFLGRVVNEDLEVLGNVHENKGLLEGNQ